MGHYRGELIDDGVIPDDTAPVDKCKRGHAFTAENTRKTKRGSRVCRACERARVRRLTVHVRRGGR